MNTLPTTMNHVPHATSHPAEGRPPEALGRVPSSSQLAHEAIARRAHELFVREGRVEGRCHEHWLRAEAELLNEGGGVRAAPFQATMPTPDDAPRR